MEQQEILSSGQFARSRNVHLKIVDDNLQSLEDFSSYLELKVTCDTVNIRCILEFKEQGTRNCHVKMLFLKLL